MRHDTDTRPQLVIKVPDHLLRRVMDHAASRRLSVPCAARELLEAGLAKAPNGEHAAVVAA